MYSSKKPFGATLLLWLVLLFTIWHGLRLWTALAWWNTLTEFSANPLYIGISGLFWLGIGLWVLRILLLKTPRAQATLLGTSAGYSGWYWIDRVLWKVPRENWIFALGVNLVVLFFVFAASFFWKREANGRKREDETTE
jgi:hypothetical protein